MSREYQQRLISRKLVQFTLSVNDYRVLSLLRTGQYTSFEIGEKLKLPDPRSNIRYLRKAGYPISDYWTVAENSRCKKYFIKDLDD